MASNRISSPFVWLCLAGIIALFCFLSVRGVGIYHFSSDEMQHVDISRSASIGDILQSSLHETHPPLSYIFFHYWMKISESQDFVRGLSLAFGVALIALYYRIGSFLGDEITGLYAAGLIAFSRGCIIQSYIVRNYIIFVFFLSLALYYYLLWRREEKPRRLAGYAVCASLACVTHFAGVFSVFCIGLYELIAGRKGPLRRQIRWCAVNGIVAAVALATYCFWRQTSSVVILNSFTTPLYGRILATLLYPLLALDYLLPRYEVALVLLVAWLLLRSPESKRDKTLQMLMGLMGVAFAVALTLSLTGTYTIVSQSRHYMWLLPFAILPAAWMLADLTRTIGSGVPRVAPQFVILAALAAGWALYDPAARFNANNGDEYMLPEKDWQDFARYLQTLDSHALIFSTKYNVFELDFSQNPYRYIGSSRFEPPMAVIMPYHHTNVIFSRSYIYSPLSLLVEEPEVKQALQTADTAVFLNFAHSDTPVSRLLTCRELKKTLIAFPPAQQHASDADTIAHASILLLEVPKDALLQDLVAPSGKAHTCLGPPGKPSA